MFSTKVALETLGKSIAPRSRDRKPTFSILVPAYREEEHIEETLRGIVVAFREGNLSFEIVVVVDAVSGDHTALHVRRACEEFSEIRVFERKGRRGVGDAIKAGTAQAYGEIVIPVMGDCSELPFDIVRLARTAKKFDVVFANRFKSGRPAGYPPTKYIANRLCNFAIRVLLGIPYCDTTNAFKAYRREILTRIDLSSKGFEIFLEMPVKAMMHASSTTEIQVVHIVRKKKAPKLSLVRDGQRYIRLLLSLIKVSADHQRRQIRPS